MAEVTLIAGVVALCVAGSVTWYTTWHRRVESRFEEVPVETRRSRAVRRDAERDRDR